MARASHRILTVLLLSLLSGCGGSERSADSAAAAESERAAESQRAEDSGDSGEASSDGEAAPEERKATCDDGTCTPCGSALCPSGWYCDESAKGGPACGWLPECARKPTCACLKRAFKDCACEEESGAAHLSCG